MTHRRLFALVVATLVFLLLLLCALGDDAQSNKPASTPAAGKLTPQDRMLIIRGLQSELAMPGVLSRWERQA